MWDCSGAEAGLLPAAASPSEMKAMKASVLDQDLNREGRQTQLLTLLHVGAAPSTVAG